MLPLLVQKSNQTRSGKGNIASSPLKRMSHNHPISNSPSQTSHKTNNNHKENLSAIKELGHLQQVFPQTGISQKREDRTYCQDTAPVQQQTNLFNFLSAGRRQVCGRGGLTSTNLQNLQTYNLHNGLSLDWNSKTRQNKLPHPINLPVTPTN